MINHSKLIKNNPELPYQFRVLPFNDLKLPMNVIYNIFDLFCDTMHSQEVMR